MATEESLLCSAILNLTKTGAVAVLRALVNGPHMSLSRATRLTTANKCRLSVRVTSAVPGALNWFKRNSKFLPISRSTKWHGCTFKKRESWLLQAQNAGVTRGGATKLRLGFFISNRCAQQIEGGLLRLLPVRPAFPLNAGPYWVFGGRRIRRLSPYENAIVRAGPPY
jgi:hypothetical protein